MAIIKRVDGEEQPHIKLGMFKLRLPFLHLNIAPKFLIQGMCLVAIPLLLVDASMYYLGVSHEVALAIAMAFLFGLGTYMTFGDATVPGLVTPAIPLVFAYLNTYEPGVDAVKALMAVQLTLAIILIVVSVTGLSDRIMKYVPVSLRAGILLGGGIASVMSCIQVAGRMDSVMMSSLAGIGVTIFLIYSTTSKYLQSKQAWFKKLIGYGLLPGFAVAILVAFGFGELSFPTIKFGVTSITPFVDSIKQNSIFAIGVPEIEYFIKGFPLAISTYIIIFGDIVMGKAIIKDADQHRDDELLDSNTSRSNLICGLVNLTFAVLTPTPIFSGPIWAGGAIAVSESYKQGRATLDSFFDGCAGLWWGMFIGLCLTPIVSFFAPTIGITMVLILLLQGYASGYIGMSMIKENSDMSIAFITSLVIAFRSLSVGLLVGIVLVLIVKVNVFNLKEKDDSKIENSKRLESN